MKIRIRHMTARHGLLYAELTIGIAITSILMLALATFTSAVSTGWHHSNDEFKVRSANTRGVTQVQDALSQMLCIVQAKPGGSDGSSAYLFCWQNDAYNGTADNKAQLGEMALVEYDPTTQAVWLYQCLDSSAMTAAQKTTASSESWGDWTSPSIVTYFKSSGILQPKKPLAGGFAGSSAGGISVTSAEFGSFAANNGKPVASYRLMLTDSNTSSAAFGNVPLRAAQIPTNLH